MKKYLLLALPLLVAACANKVDVEESLKYKCGDQVVMVDFLEDDSAVLRLDGTDYVLDRMVSASGAKYQGKNITFWNKGSESFLKVGNKNYPKCAIMVK